MKFPSAVRLLAALVPALTPFFAVANTGAHPFGLLLTWQRDPSTTMTVQWMERSETPPPPVALRHWNAAHSKADAAEATTTVQSVELWPDMHIHRAELTGLLPDTAHRFRAEGWHADYGFTTMPAVPRDAVKFAVGACARPYAGRSLEATLSAMMEHSPRFLLWGGHLAHAKARMRDVVERARRWDAWFDAMASALIDEARHITPVVAAIGETEVMERFVFNHPSYQQIDDYRRYMGPYFYQLFAFPGQPGYNVLDFGDYLSLVVLDSDHSNPVDGEQTEWLEKTLAARRGVPHVFPVYHVSAYPGGQNAMEVNDPARPWRNGYDGYSSARVRRYWSPLFETHGVRVAFEHYGHVYKRTVPIRNGEHHPEGVVYLGDGALGETPAEPRDAADSWYLAHSTAALHAIIVTLSPDGSARFIAVDNTGAVIDEHNDTQ